MTGAAFSASAAAAALDQPVEAAEERLGALARRGSFVRLVEHQRWPDGTKTDGYRFIHALYQNVLYDRLGASAPEPLPSPVPASASRPAIAIGSGQTLRRNWRCISSAAATRGARCVISDRRARARFSAVPTSKPSRCSHQGLTLLSALPASAERDAWEVQLRVPLGVCYTNTRGYAAPEAGTTFQRALDLCRPASRSLAPVPCAVRPLVLRVAAGRSEEGPRDRGSSCCVPPRMGRTRRG